MTKLKPTKIGFSLGILLIILYILRALILLTFPDFVVKTANEILSEIIVLSFPQMTIVSFIKGIILFFIAGFVCGFLFGWIYNWFEK